MKLDTTIHKRAGAKTRGQRRLAVLLFCLLALLYYGFYLVGMVAPDALMQSAINEVPLSFLAGAVIILASITITFIYAFAANRMDEKEGA